MKRIGLTVTLAVTAFLTGCGADASTDASATAPESTTTAASSSAPPTSTAASGSARSTVTNPPAASSKPTATTVGGSSSAADPVAVTNCTNAQEAYAQVVAALGGSDEAIRNAAAEAAAPPVDTNTRSQAGRAATTAILDLQQAALQVAAQGSQAATDFRSHLATVRSACQAVGAPVFTG